MTSDETCAEFLERTVKALVARSCSESAPEGLRERVLLQLRQVQVRITEV